MLFPLLAGGTAVVAVAAGYNTMAPRSQLYGRTFIGEATGSRRLALTFDDGPNAPHTLTLLEVLALHGVRATFFMLGRHVRQCPEIARAVARAGHVIGNHSYTHPNMIFCSQRQIRRQIENCANALEDAVGETSRLFRPPHGGRRPGVLRAVRKMGYEPVMWSVSSWDWRATSPAQIERTVGMQVRGGDVILLHDGGHQQLGVDRSLSVRATDLIIRRYLAEGYTFVTVPEMMEPAAGRR
jgi:peptidoglycan/xylan/chitin deacetylase (PgdA/CDA1 family)